MMARDCNRFCKTMRLPKKSAADSGNGVHKERMKITFADETGHVKVFADCPIPLLRSKSEKPEPLAN
ncbi:hypothetical protein HHK36_002456 [Tetracentron sinense]|uniref:Uncharacterized protein n=1 Tax=Tetracentron sinense TaxID=13715 RepID=A0A835DRL4_TETSI|nr:hypothetical protein HHK36_002456 [Tetracentron sinense]